MGNNVKPTCVAVASIGLASPGTGNATITGREWNIRIARVFALAAVLVLSGCAVGSNFVRPDEHQLSLGTTSYQQLISRLGEPRGTGSAVSEGVTLTTASWTYVESSFTDAAAAPGTYPFRSFSAVFNQGALVAYAYVSSFKGDVTDFDDSKVAKIEKGVMKRDEVIALLGRPSGEMMYPATKLKEGRVLTYHYWQASRFLAATLQKDLQIQLDDRGIVQDTAYSEATRGTGK
jgi:hypothetical protein